MRKANRGQTVGNLSTRAGVHPAQRKLRKKAEDKLITAIELARYECSKSPNNRNRGYLDSLNKRFIRRQVRALRRMRKARALQ